ncbi:MAG TPA: tRNA (N6-isopentenyl adenosine(37)-C2)-methylthiotransferase MiaB, partial [Alphaproteobacteria bacterium]|nr:tRNA (N6-isopentenyl adenosine(37)-C2)-methylthiotransferase MiaB [Alphaproteobacteria bacterium]
KFRDARPDIAFSSDFIIGFPGETDEDFEATMELVEKVGYGSAYSFKYSARPGTPAANMQNLVREDIKDSRLQQLQALLTQQALTINQSFIGKTVSVLFDRPHSLESNKLHGRTQYNQAVHVELPSAAPPRSLEGQVLDVTVTRAGQMALHGNIQTAQENAA